MEENALTDVSSDQKSYIAIIHQPVTVSPNVEPNACTNIAFTSTSTRLNPYFGQRITPAKVGIKS